MEEKDEKTNEKVQALREMIYSAEKTLQGAKSMLLQLEGKKKVGRKKKVSEEDAEGGRIVEGTFDGQIMIGTDGKQYPVPANYASKSKLIEGDMLKLTITPDGSFIYKQIGPTDRKRLIGIVSLDAQGDYFVAAEGMAYKVLLASITYFKVEPGDEVTLVTPANISSDWGSIENVLQKDSKRKQVQDAPSQKNIDEILGSKNSSDDSTTAQLKKEESVEETNETAIVDEWAPDLEELKKELNNNLNANS
jgi:hypothetical protein